LRRTQSLVVGVKAKLLHFFVENNFVDNTPLVLCASRTKKSHTQTAIDYLHCCLLLLVHAPELKPIAHTEPQQKGNCEDAKGNTKVCKGQ